MTARLSLPRSKLFYFLLILMSIGLLFTLSGSQDSLYAEET